ncbi:MAG TPA: hypothetical protein VK663_02420 [Burkholderiales bacterium]|nr:hypothetical protein [Burkholderiales bacterium]
MRKLRIRASDEPERFTQRGSNIIHKKLQKLTLTIVPPKIAEIRPKSDDWDDDACYGVFPKNAAKTAFARD